MGEEGIKNRDFTFYFFFNLPNNNVSGSVNQSIIKKGLTDINKNTACGVNQVHLSCSVIRTRCRTYLGKMLLIEL